MKPKHMITVSISEQHRDSLLRLAKWLHGGDIAKTVEAALDQYAEKLAGAWDQGEAKTWRQGTVNGTFDQYKTTPGNPAERQDTKP